jgi:hypothetical protein
MALFEHKDYERLEQSVTRGHRISVRRRGSEFVVIPVSISLLSGREVISARHPTTGDMLKLFLDEIDGFEVIG